MSISKQQIVSIINTNLMDFLPYLTEDINITITMSSKTGINVKYTTDEGEDFLSNSIKAPSPETNNNHTNKEKRKFVSDYKAVLAAQTEPNTLIVQKELDYHFLNNKITIPKERLVFLETYFEESLEELRGEDVRIVLDNKIYLAHFAVNKSYTGKPCSVYIQWPNHCALQEKLNDIFERLKEKSNVNSKQFNNTKNKIDLADKLILSYELYAISDTKAFKLIIREH